ncbi:MAG: M48 family metallopeptidase [marine benthic group bacterium]|jgi:Zn-dependent protease with chaperone function|nr:M48 family metallopeptidase [Candidatus Benthicola marisminoris]
MDEQDNQNGGNGETGGDGGDITSSGGGFQRRILTEISPQAWEHPADRAALNALRKIPGFDLALRKIFGMFGERAIRLAFKANAVRVSPKQYPWIHERTLRVCEIMDLEEVPEVYVSQTPLVNAGAVGMSEPFIVLNSSMLEVLSRDEVEAVLAHEVGHILSGHVLYRTLLLLVMRLALFRYPIAGLALLPILWALLEWYRKSELSCDRAALLAVQDKDIVMSSLMQLAGGTRGETLDLQEFIAQSEEYRHGGDLLDSVYKVLNVIGATHPFSVMRVAELRDWIDSGAYDKIMTGEYPRRSDEDLKPYREDVAEAMKGYTDAAQEIFDEVDAAVDKLKTRFTDAWRRGRGEES